MVQNVVLSWSIQNGSVRVAFKDKNELKDTIDVARGLKKCTTVLKNATYLNVFTGEWQRGDVALHEGRIVGICESYDGHQEIDCTQKFIVPGFIDSHVHIESTLMTPNEYQKVVLPRGTTSAFVDPHEIVNVLGEKGFEYFLECASKSQMDIYVMLSSCVPATTNLETSGARIESTTLLKFKNHPNVVGLAEMMNFPGVLFKDEGVVEKLFDFQDVRIDGHCPMLRGKDLNAYIAAGMSSCHESVGLEEAKEKLDKGMLVQLREGSVAKNLRDLCSILTSFSCGHVGLSTDDRNPVDILDEGHMDYLIRLAIKEGIPSEVVYKSASWSAANHYGIKSKGAIAPGYVADIVVLSDRETVKIDFVFKSGEMIKSYDDVRDILVRPPKNNTMNYELPVLKDLEITSMAKLEQKIRAIEVIPNQIITRERLEILPVIDGKVGSNPNRDILKIAVLERHGNRKPISKGFVSGFGFERGAIGSSVGHDSHNAVVVGANDDDMRLAFEWLKSNGGGFVAIDEGRVIAGLPLPIAGLMSDSSLDSIYKNMHELRTATRDLGGRLDEPFLQLAFLCLPVIPDLKITDLGLVDVNKFSFVDLLL
ncbi:MAG: adenine deaminase [Bdellovibrionales bacterium]|nr:adenine deaminase [Bdellovibrionales bacterium]